MQKIFLLIPIFLLTASVYGQDTEFEYSISVSNYQIDTISYRQYSHVIRNISDTPLLIWLEKENMQSSSDAQMYRKYFKTQKGDFVLTALIYESLINDISDILFLTFYKILEPEQEFRIVFLSIQENQSEGEVTEWLEEHLAIIPYSESKGMLPIKDLQKLNYKSDIITINAHEILKHEMSQKNTLLSERNDTITYWGLIKKNLLYETIEL